MIKWINQKATSITTAPEYFKTEAAAAGVSDEMKLKYEKECERMGKLVVDMQAMLDDCEQSAKQVTTNNNYNN